MKPTLIQGAKAIVTCDSTDRVYYDADILIEGPKICAIGKNLKAEGADVIHAQGKFIYPGLINTHHHFFQTFIRNLSTVDYPRMEVTQWLEIIYDIFRYVDSEVLYYSALTAFADLIKHGCTCAFDHQYCYNEHTGKEGIDRQMQAADLLGIRYHAGRGVNTSFQIGTPEVMLHMQETLDEYLQDSERLIARYHDPNPFSMHQIVLAPCQPLNCTKETFTQSLSLARKHGLRLHTHMGEGENEGMLAQYGMRTWDWLQEIGFVGDDIFVAHGWELTKAEYQSMGKFGMGVSHCPGPAILGGYPILDIQAMQQAGVVVSLGCDGSATNDSSSLLDALRMSFMMQAYFNKQREGYASPYDMLKVATIYGAQTLGRQDIGSLEAGKAADLFMVDVSTLDMAGALHDPKNLLARTGVTGPVWLTMINGKVVFQDGQLMGVDEAKLAEQAEQVCTKVIRAQNPKYYASYHY